MEIEPSVDFHLKVIQADQKEL